MKLSELEVLNLHAQGGMAEVYRARVANPDGTEKIYAVKKILPHFTKEQELVRMFIEEARVAACLNCEQIVQVFDLVMSDTGEYFIVMEFADGKDLADVIYFAGQRKKRLPISMAVQVARDTLKALHYAYNATDSEGRPLRLVHRDVSPHNIIITYDGRVKLTDFGIAKVQASANKTMAGVIKGKFGYMSPEQARGKPLDGRSDLFNIGIVLYEAFTGDRLFQGASDLDTLDKMRAAMVPRLPANLGVPGDIETLMRKALEREAAGRFPDAATFERELAAAAEKHGVLPRAGEIVQTMCEVFPAETAAKGPQQPVKTRHVELKSQLWRDGQPAAPVARPPSPAAAAPAPAMTPVDPPAMPASALPQSVKAGDALPSQRPKGGGAAVRAGGGARALDVAPARPMAEDPASTRLESRDAIDSALAGTRVEDAPAALRAPPPPPAAPSSAPRSDPGKTGVVASSQQVRALPMDGASAKPAAPRPAPIVDPPTQPPETEQLSAQTIAMAMASVPPPPPAALGGAPAASPPPPAALASPVAPPPPPPATLVAAALPPPPPSGLGAPKGTPPPPASAGTGAPPPPMPTATPAAPQPAVRVAAPPPVPARRQESFLDGPGRYLVALGTALFGVVLGAGLMVAAPTGDAQGNPELRTLMVVTTPPGAIAVLDGDRLGVTPLIVDRKLDDGVHTIRLTATKGGAVSRKVQVKEGERSLVVSANLFTMGTVVIDTVPPGARISVDGAEVGESPVAVERVSTDRAHAVEASLAGYVLTQASIPTDRPEVFRMTVPLASAKGDGKLALLASHEAEVELDGLPWGKTSRTSKPCAPGQHKVVLRAPGRPASPTYTISVPAAGAAQYYFDLGAIAPGSRL